MPRIVIVRPTLWCLALAIWVAACGESSTDSAGSAGSSDASSAPSGAGQATTGGDPAAGPVSGSSGLSSASSLAGASASSSGSPSFGGSSVGGASSGTAGSSSNGGNGGSSAAGRAGNDGLATNAWDWNGIVGTGQSLSVGTPPNLSTTQPYHNLKLSLGPAGNSAVPPWDPNISGLSMVPLVEPIRQTAPPKGYPVNIWGETPHSAMGNEITALVKQVSPSADYVTVHTVVGESGKSLSIIDKQTGSTTGTNGRAYAATLFEAQAITRLAKAAGKSYGIGVIVMTHGENDKGNSQYGKGLLQLLNDYNTDLSAITGQKQRIVMYVSQQHGLPRGAGTLGQRPIVNNIEWQLGVTNKGDFVCTGPKYQYQGNASNDGVHLSSIGYQLLGEKVGEVYYQRQILGSDWQPLMPLNASRSGRVVSVKFHVPVPPLNWDASLDAPFISEWVNGRGFELRTSSMRIGIASVAISGDSVQVTANSDLPASGLVVGYALSGQGQQMKTGSKAVRWGQLRDSDPFIGTTTKLPNANYSVSFDMPVP